MNNYSLSHPYGMSSLWPAINIPFLSLQGIPDHAMPSHRIQKIYRELLIGFDALTSCELKEFYKFKLFLQKLDHQAPLCPELHLIVQALRAWVNFDYAHARQLFRQHLQLYPSDVIAFFMTHMFDFCTGNIPDLLTDLLVCDVYLIDTYPLHPFYLAIKSFVLCEANYVFLAHTLGYIAVQHAPTHIYAIHSITHALHEQACWGYLCEFLEKRKPDWITNKNMRIHISWHLAIAYEKNHQTIKSLHTFHEMYALKDHLLAKQDLDAVAYLWRYQLKHPDDQQFTALWQKLACLWSGSIGTSMSYFHQLHAALAFAACRYTLLIEKLIAESDGFGIYPTAHKVGKSILQAILFFAQDRYQACYRQLKMTQNQWSILGGSKAQRELLSLTMHTCLQKTVTHQPG